MGFKVGDCVQSKGGDGRHGTIVSATEGKPKHHWDVRFDDTGTVEQKTRWMLKSPAAEVTIDSISQQVNSLVLDKPQDSNASNASFLFSDEADILPDSDSSTESETDTTSSTAGSFEAMFPEMEAAEEDFGYIPNENGDDVEELQVEIEPEEIYAAKHRVYVREKADLLNRGHAVVKKPSDEGIHIGSHVQTKRVRERQFGKVVGRSSDDKDWMVLWQGSSQPVQINFKFLMRAIPEEDNTPYVWNLISESVPVGVEPEEYGDIGLTNFSFDQFSAASKAQDDMQEEHPYQRLLEKMWHGDWRQQKSQVNARIKVVNKLPANVRNKNYRKIELMSDHEWWMMHGIILSAAAFGKGGSQLWEKESHRVERTMTSPINLGLGTNGMGVMADYRFKQLKGVYPWAFEDKQAGEHPWKMILLGLNGYNKSRRDWIAASVMKILDESMSAWCPQSSKTGGLPHLSFILRKPEPLGTEFKCICCAETGKKSAMVPSDSLLFVAVDVFFRLDLWMTLASVDSRIE